jgi:hypothetical protein
VGAPPLAPVTRASLASMRWPSAAKPGDPWQSPPTPGALATLHAVACDDPLALQRALAQQRAELAAQRRALEEELHLMTELHAKMAAAVANRRRKQRRAVARATRLSLAGRGGSRTCGSSGKCGAGGGGRRGTRGREGGEDTVSDVSGSSYGSEEPEEEEVVVDEAVIAGQNDPDDESTGSACEEEQRQDSESRQQSVEGEDKGTLHVGDVENSARACGTGPAGSGRRQRQAARAFF